MSAARIAEIQEKLAEIAELKKLEPKLKKELAELEAQSAEEDEEEDDQQEEEVEDEPTPPAPEPVPAPVVVADVAPEPEPVKQVSPEEQRAKKIKGLNKKLQQIATLKAKGGDLDPEAQAKIDREPLLKKQIAILKEGKDLPDEDEEPAAPAAPEPVVEGPTAVEGSKAVVLPSDPAEREKRLKALKKKLAQITTLKEKDGSLDKEAQEKVDNERSILREVAALEGGEVEFILGPPTDHEKHEMFLETKHDLERKIKAITKKLAAIDGHKEKDDLDDHAKVKVENEAGLKKEKGELERRLGALNKEEALRVAKRLDFEDDHHAHHEEKKASKKKKGR